MRTVLAIAALLTLGACADGPAPEGDVATYDALKIARVACEAKGGELILAKEGLATRMSAYECKRKSGQ